MCAWAMHCVSSRAGSRSTVDGSSIALHLEVGKHIDALAISTDLRYVAVAVSGEIVVVDTQRNAIATLTIGVPIAQQLSFLDATSLAFNEPGALKTLRVDRLDYVPFEPAPEPRNSASYPEYASAWR